MIENRGYLPSHVLSSARKLTWNEAPYLELECDGCGIAEGGPRRSLGHLDGWGRGIGGGLDMPHLPWGRGSTGTARQSFVIKGNGTLTATVKSCRLGAIRRELTI